MIQILTDRLTVDDKQRVHSLFTLLGINGYSFITSEDIRATDGLNLIVLGVRSKAFLDKNFPDTPCIYFENFQSIFETGNNLQLRALADALGHPGQGIIPKASSFEPKLEELQDRLVIYTQFGNYTIWPDDKFPTNPRPSDIRLSTCRSLKELKELCGNSPIGILTSKI